MASESRGSYFCIIILCIISLPLVLIWFLASYSGLSITSWPQTTQSCQCQNDEPTLLPPVIKVFRSSRNLTAISIHDLSLHHEIEDSDQRTWEDLLLPSKAGSIFLEDEKSKVGPYGVSMFHQLHCLAMIRKAFLNAFAQENGEGAVADASMGKTPNPLGHLGHCFHYLAQVSADSNNASDSFETKNGYRVLFAPRMTLLSRHPCYLIAV